jgi:hypothetical protein
MPQGPNYLLSLTLLDRTLTKGQRKPSKAARKLRSISSASDIKCWRCAAKGMNLKKSITRGQFDKLER